MGKVYAGALAATAIMALSVGYVAAAGDMPPETGSITGRVVGCASDNVSNVSISLSLDSQAPSVEPDAQGGFRLEDLTSGTHQLMFSVDGHEMHKAAVEVQPGQVADIGPVDFTALIACPAMYDPVCGADGVTYGNACEAHLVCARVAHPGEC